VCCSVLQQCVAAVCCSSVLQLQCVAVAEYGAQMEYRWRHIRVQVFVGVREDRSCVAEYCNVLQCVVIGCNGLHSVSVRCIALQSVAVCYSVLQCV